MKIAITSLQSVGILLPKIWTRLSSKLPRRGILGGWDVSDYSSELSGNPQVQAATPEGYYFQLKEGNDELRLTGSSPVYWANLDELQDAVVQRLDAEDVAGTVTWDATDRDDDDVGRRMPGEYRDFPAGDS